MIRINRFQRKIVIIIIVVAAAPLLAALLLGRVALRENYRLGLNERLQHRLQTDLGVYRATIALHREHAEQAMRVLARDAAVGDALQQQDPRAIELSLIEALAGFPQALQAQVHHPSGMQVHVVLNDPDEPMRTKELRTVIHDWEIVLKVGIAEALFSEFRAAGQVAQDYAVLVAGARYLSNRYLAVFVILMLLVIGPAIGFGIASAAQLTKRVSVLSSAMSEVARGDLQVRVPAQGQDEVADLSRSFNTMVGDLAHSRARIDYLQRISAWQEVARRLAHEIKNPLTPIQLAMQEVHRAYQGSDERYRQKLDQAAQITSEEIQTLRHLVSEFSEFAKLPKARLQSVDLSVFAAEFIENMRYEWDLASAESSEAASITIREQIAASPVRVDLDPILMRRALANLMLNAKQALLAHVQYMMHQGDTSSQTPSSANSAEELSQKCTEFEPIVLFNVQIRDSFAEIVVQDNGPGIPEAYRARIFDPYFTSTHDGTGLGLAIVKTVVLEHHGNIELFPGEHGGASFVIRLPIIA